jgi:phospholipid-binding lipoprotein MlaA
MRALSRRSRSILTIAYFLGCMCVATTAAAGDQGNRDPLESFNRGVFWFNNQLDDYVLEPIAKGWEKITPARLRKSVSNFFQNLCFPIVAGNNLLQAKPVRAASDVARFAVNTTVGAVGLFDPASGWGLEQHNEDFGQTLGYWGLPPGPYLVLPFFGSSDPRDTVGLVADFFSTVYPYFVAFQYTAGANAVSVINERALVLKEVREFKRASFDYYVAVRNAYLQRRDALVHDRPGMSEQQQQDLYTIEDNGDEGR